MERERRRRDRRGDRGERRGGASGGRRDKDVAAAPQRPIILAKPKSEARLNDEEWPSIAQSSRTGSPTNKPVEVLGRPACGEQPSSSQELERPVRRDSPQIVAGIAARPGSSSRLASEYTRKIDLLPKTTPIGGGVGGSAVSLLQTASTASLKAPDQSNATTAVDTNMRAAVQLIGENLEWIETPNEHLFDGENTDFLVIGAIGPQGTGKSTLLSMLGGNDPFDMYRQYIFRPASREAVETCHHQTGGVQVYVTQTRTILMDCQAICCLSVLDDVMRMDRRYNYEYKAPENSAEIESLQLLGFMLQTCHVILLCVDWFIDLNLIRFLRQAASLRPSVSQGAQENILLVDRKPTICVVHQRSKSDDYQPIIVRDRCRLLQRLLAGADYNLTTGISLSNTNLAGFCQWKDELSEINYYPLSDLKLRSQKIEEDSQKQQQTSSNANDLSCLFDTTPTYDQLIAELRILARRQPREPFTSSEQGFTEKAWFAYAGRCWDLIRRSSVISEYGRFLY